MVAVILVTEAACLGWILALSFASRSKRNLTVYLRQKCFKRGKVFKDRHSGSFEHHRSVISSKQPVKKRCFQWCVINSLKLIISRKILVNVAIFNSYIVPGSTGNALLFTADPAKVYKQQRSP